MTALLLAAPVALVAAQEGDPWAAAQELPPGDERTAAVVASLADDVVAGLDPRAVQERLQVAFDAFLAEMDAFRGDAALAIAEAMHGRARAVWSSFCLEGALRRGAGADGPEARATYARADAVLAELRAASTDPAARLDLLQRRALVADGAGREALSDALYGRVLGFGGTDGYQVLGLEALEAGARVPAARLFGALLDGAARPDGTPPPDDEAPPWALRGFGLALLPAGPDPVAPSASSANDSEDGAPSRR